MPTLFSELNLKDIRLRNRIAVSPMCQYSAAQGVPNNWHLVNLGSRAVGGAGLVIAEATAVSPEGRISPGDTGLWNDVQREAFRPIVHFVEQQGAVPGIQLAHAGRKASARRPWEGDDHLAPSDPEAWETIAPSSNPFGGHLPRLPRAMSRDDITRVKRDFVDAARRAQEAGFKWLVLHFAHGYLAQSFFSPLANQRTDEYGGSFENRARFLLETFDAVRTVWPERLPLTVRLGMLDYVAGEQPIEESIELVRRLKDRGLDLLDLSLGFNTPNASGVPFSSPAFLAPLAERVRRELGILTAASWNVGEPQVADEVIRKEQLDVVMLAKAMLRNPYWPYQAAQVLGRPHPEAVLPAQYAHWLKTPAK
jgi:2,4-dienoyl-CoA reductase-like NADH-dependent reductase (Old Yellow Enzyme family)